MSFWKVPSRGKFYSLFIDDDEDEKITDFFQEFMAGEIKNSETGKQFILKAFQFAS
jgi:nucleoid-associated protein YejK